MPSKQDPEQGHTTTVQDAAEDDPHEGSLYAFLRRCGSAIKPIPSHPYFVQGDWMAVAALASDNLGLVLIAFNLLISVGIPKNIVQTSFITSCGLTVFLGNLLYWFQARRLVISSRQSEVCAQPFGLNAPGIYIFTFGIITIELAAGSSPETAYAIAVAANFWTGLIQLLLAPFAPMIVRHTPKPALFGCIGGVALVYLIVGQLVDFLAEEPIVTMIPLILVMAGAFGACTTRLPIIVYALVFGTAIAWAQGGVGALINVPNGTDHFQYANVEAVRQLSGIGPTALAPVNLWPHLVRAISKYSSLIIPTALSIIVGGVVGVELCAAGDDEYNVIETCVYDALLTITGACLGSMMQVTTYPNHPGYKRFGGRTGYSLAHGVGFLLIAFFGLVQAILVVIPVYAISPTIVFVGFMILSEGIVACEGRIYQVSAFFLAIAPAIANYCQGLGVTNLAIASLASGYILIGLGWAALLITLVECKFVLTSAWAVALGILTLLGVIHSMPGDQGGPAWVAHPSPGTIFPDVHDMAQAWRWCVAYGSLLPVMAAFWLMQRYPDFSSAWLGIQVRAPRNAASRPKNTRSSLWEPADGAEENRFTRSVETQRWGDSRVSASVQRWGDSRVSVSVGCRSTASDATVCQPVDPPDCRRPS